MARCSLFKKKPKLTVESEGCRSHCDSCSSLKLCGGCTGLCMFDSHYAKCPDGLCGNCPVRCWRRPDLEEWEFEVDGFDFASAKCKLPYTGEIPTYLPQIRDNANGVYHPAYIINIAKLLNPKTMQLLHRATTVGESRLRKKWNIPKETKLILSFCCKDDIIDYIWAHQCDEWSPGKDFWQTIATYGFDAALSIDYSCYLNYPRLDHLTNMKRNIISAQRLALNAIPVIFDVMAYDMRDLERLVLWAKDNDFVWFHLNFQKTYKIDWLQKIIEERCDRIFELVPSAKIIISGIGDEERILAFDKKYSGRICCSTANASIHSRYGRLYDPNTQKWIANKNLSVKDLFVANLAYFSNLGQRA